MIDEQLTEQGLRYPVYGWAEKDGFFAKFEEFLGDYKDFLKFPGSFEDGNIRDEVIKRLATLHGGGKLRQSSFVGRTKRKGIWNVQDLRDVRD